MTLPPRPGQMLAFLLLESLLLDQETTGHPDKLPYRGVAPLPPKHKQQREQ
jgi:hypothetical protein